MATATLTATTYNLWNNNYTGASNSANCDLGRLVRSNGYVSEVLCVYDISSIPAGSTITAAAVRFTVTGSQSGTGSQTVNLVQQNKTNPTGWPATPVYDTFGNFPGTHTAWDTVLSSVSSVLSNQEYTIASAAATVTYIQSWLTASTNNWGLVLTRNDSYFDYFVTLNGTIVYLDLTYTASRASVISCGMDFDSASSQYLASVSTFTKPSDVSVAFWLYLLEAPGTNIMTVLGYDDLWEIRLGTAQVGKISNDLNASGTEFYSATTLVVSTRYHIVCTCASGGSATIVINGVIDKTATGQSGSPAASGTLRIGHRTGLTGGYLNGILEDVRIYDRVLSEAECLTIYSTKGTDGITYGLLNRWLLNDGPQSTAASGAGVIKDIGINGNNMTPSNSPKYNGTFMKRKRFA